MNLSKMNWESIIYFMKFINYRVTLNSWLRPSAVVPDISGEAVTTIVNLDCPIRKYWGYSRTSGSCALSFFSSFACSRSK